MAWRNDGFAGWLAGLTDPDVDSLAAVTEKVVGSVVRGVSAVCPGEGADD